MSILTFIGTIFKPAVDLIDDLHLSKEEEATLKNELEKIQVQVKEKVIDLESKTIEGQAKIIEAEARSDSWLTKNWRPMVIMSLFCLIVLDYFGVSSSDGLPEQAWRTIDIALGGYIGGRSVEKVARIVKTST